MDKIIGLLTVIFVGFPLTIITMIISWGMNHELDNGCDQGQLDRDSDIRIYVPSRIRNRRSNNRHDKECKR